MASIPLAAGAQMQRLHMQGNALVSEVFNSPELASNNLN